MLRNGMTCSEAGRLGAVAGKQKNTDRFLRKKYFYELAPKKCLRCASVIRYRLRENDFCGRSCAAIINNARRAKVFTCEVCSVPVGRRVRWCDNCRPNIGNSRMKSSSDAESDGTRRRALLRERGRKCCSCGLKEWLGHDIPIEVDHVDGNHLNNSQDNLRLLCPNCHALTPTFKNKNRGNGRVYRMDRYRLDKEKRLISSEVEQRTCNPPA